MTDAAAPSGGEVTVLPYGPNAVLAEVGSAADAAALHAWLAADAIAGVRALVPAAATVLVEAEPAALPSVVRRLAAYRADPHRAERPTTDVVTIPVVYDGADLDQVAELTGLGRDEVVRRHSQPTYIAAFCGFSPGFAYLIGGDPALRLPRRETPRTRVPAGAVAIAGEFSAVYPSPSPGGWRLLGHTTAAVWDVDREPPATIVPGARVRFEASGRR